MLIWQQKLPKPSTEVTTILILGKCLVNLVLIPFNKCSDENGRVSMLCHLEQNWYLHAFAVSSLWQNTPLELDYLLELTPQRRVQGRNKSTSLSSRRVIYPSGKSFNVENIDISEFLKIKQPLPSNNWFKLDWTISHFPKTSNFNSSVHIRKYHHQLNLLQSVFNALQQISP